MIISRFLSNLFFRGAWMKMSNDAGSFCRLHVSVLSPRLLRLMAKWKKKSLSPANPHYSHIAQSVLFPSRTMIRPSYMLFSLIYLCLYDHYWSLQMDFSTDQKISFQSVFHFSNTTHSHTAHTHASSVLERFNFYSFHFVLVFLRLLLFPVAAAITAAAWLCLLCLLYLDEKHLPSSVSSSFSFAYSSSLCSYAHLVLCGCVCSIETHTKAEPYVHSCNTFPAFMYTCVCVSCLLSCCWSNAFLRLTLLWFRGIRNFRMKFLGMQHVCLPFDACADLLENSQCFCLSHKQKKMHTEQDKRSVVFAENLAFCACHPF